MPMIYSSLDMFDFTQAVRIIEDDGSQRVVYCSAADLPTTIAELCKEKNITDIHFYGNEVYVNKIVEDTKQNYNLHYHCGNPLNIEVN